MTTHIRRLSVAAVIAIVAGGVFVRAQQQGGLSAADKTRRWDLENELQSIAVVERKVMMPMRDGVRLATDIYRPKNADRSKVPTIFVRTPYNFNFWDVLRRPADMTAALMRSSADTHTSYRTSAGIFSPKATTTSSARRDGRHDAISG